MNEDTPLSQCLIQRLTVLLAITLLVLIAAAPVSAATPITSSNHVWINVANDAGVKYDMDSVYYGGLTTGNNTYYIKAEGGGLNELHVTNANDAASAYGQVTASNAQSGVFYISNTGGRGFDNDIILLVSVKGPIPDDFAFHITSSGYNWTNATPGVYTPAVSTVDYYYVTDALDETFTSADFIYGPQTTRPGPSGFQPLYYGQDTSDSSTEEYLMFIDLNAGNLYPSKFYDSGSGTYFNATHTGLPAPVDNGNVKVEYSFTNMTTHASFNGFGWCTAANQNEGINWANQGTGSTASGYSVNGAPFAAFFSDVQSGTAPLTVQFTDQSVNYTAVTYAWDFGDGSTSTDQSPSHTYSTAGTYTATQTVTNSAGSSSATKTITVSETTVAPAAAFSYLATDLSVAFTDASTGTPTSWAWDFGDGSTSTDQNPTHVYSAAGTYTITLTATNTVGSNTATQTVTVSETTVAPTAAFSYLATDLSVAFTDASTGTPTSWAWDFGDGSTSTDQNPTHVYSAAGTYTITLTATNTVGSNTATQTVTVAEAIPAPVAGFSGTPTSGTAPLTVQFTDSSMNSPTAYAWYFGDENYTSSWTQMNASAGWTTRWNADSVALPDGSLVMMGGQVSDGNVNDSWRSTDKGTTWTQMTANASWAARHSASSVALSDGSILVFGGTDNEGGSHYNDVWKSTDKGATWTQVTPNAGWTARFGQTSVILPDGSIVLMGGYTSTAVNDVWRSDDNGLTWVQVNASAGWSGRYFFSAVALQDGSIVVMDGYNGAMLRDVWRSTDNGATWTQMTSSAGWSARDNAAVVALPDGNILLIGGYSSSRLNDVWRSTDNGATWTQVTSSAWSSGRSSLTAAVLTDGSIVVTGGYTSSGPVNDVWRLPTAGSNTQNPFHTFTIPGSYTVTLLASNAGGSSTAVKTGYITANYDTPVADFTTSATSGVTPLFVRFNDTSINTPTSWSWNFGDGSTSALQNTTHTYMAAGTYTVTLTAMNAAGSNDKTAIITVSAGSENGGLANSAWPKFGRDINNTGQSPYVGPQSGSVKWRYITGSEFEYTGSEIGYAGPSVGSDGTVYVGSYDNHLYAINPDGTQKWNYTTSNSIYGSPAIAADGTIYTGSRDYKLYALNSDGSLKWSYTTGSRIYSSPAIGPDGTVYVGGYDKKFYAINPDGTLKWSYTAGNYFYYTAPAIGPDGTIYIGNYDTKLYAFNPDGTLKWSYTTGGRIYGAAAIGSDGTIYVGSYDKNLYAINPDGTLKWSYTTENYIYGAPAIAADGTIYIGIYNGGVYALNPDGTLKWVYYTNYRIDGSPVIDADGTVYVGGYDGIVYALNPDGTQKWNYQTGSNIKGSPAIGSDGTLYIGNYYGILYAFRDPDTPPVAAFTSDVQTGYAPLTVYFTDQSTNSPISWLWDFGDGSTENATVQNPVHTFASAGTYTVNLTATNAAGSDDESKADYITVREASIPAPVAAFSGSPTIGTAPLTVTFTDQSTNTPTDWAWDFGDNPGSVYIGDTNNNLVKQVFPNGSIATIGSFTGPQGVFMDREGNLYVATTVNSVDVIFAKNGSTASIPLGTHAAYDVAVDSHGNIFFGDISTPGVFQVSPSGTIVPVGSGISWQGPYGIAVDSHDNVYAADAYLATVYEIFAENGTHRTIGSGLTMPADVAVDIQGNVYVTDGGANQVRKFNVDGSDEALGGSFSFNLPIHLDVDNLGNVYVADAYNNQIEQICPNGTVVVLATGLNYPNGVAFKRADSYEQNPSHKYSTPGSYTVYLTAANADGSDVLTQSDYITVTAAVVAPVAGFTSDVQTGTAPLTVTFTDVSTNSPTSWAWDFGDGSTENTTVQNPVHTFASAGTYTVNLTATNAAGSDDESKADYITVSTATAAPVADFTASTTIGFAPLEVSFTDVSTNSPTSWAWDFNNDGTIDSTEQNATTTYSAAGTYTVKLTATNAEGSDDETKTGFITVETPGGVMPGYNNIFVGVANEGGVKYDAFANNTYNIRFEGINRGLNALHISTDPSVNFGQVTETNSQSGTFYATDSGGKGYEDEIILMVAVNGTIPDDFSIRITSDGYTWTPNTASNTAPDLTTVIYQATALDETFTKEDFIYGPQIWKPTGNEADYPIFYGQDLTDTANTFHVMFVDLNAGVLRPNTALENQGAVRINYSIQNLDSLAAFSVYGYCQKSNNGNDMVAWTNALTADKTPSGYAVYAVPAPVAAFTADVTTGAAPLTVTFTDQSTNTPTSWAWNFDNNATIDASTQNPSYTYTVPGIYTVNLTSGNEGGIGSVVKEQFITVTGPLPNNRHIFFSVANEDGVKYDLDSAVYGGPADSYYIKADGGGLNELHITADSSVAAGQVTATTSPTTDPSGVFYVSNTGGRGFDDDIIVLLAVNGTLPDDFSVDIRTSGYSWTPSSVTNQAPTDYIHGTDVVVETFTKDDFIYGPHVYKPGPGTLDVWSLPLYYGQNTADGQQYQLMFVDTKVGNMYLGKYTGWESLTDGGSAKVEFQFHNLTSQATFNAYGWCLASNQGQGISWTNRMDNPGASGYSVVYTPLSVPVAAFTSDTQTGTAPLTVTFTDSSTNTPTSWAWDFGDGSTENATVQNPVHTFALAGTYTVNLTATNAAGSDDELKVDYITVTSGVVTLPGQAKAPTDTDGDGLYDDLNGNGEMDFNDVILYFNNLEWIESNEPVALFDYNGNDEIDFNDLIVLFNEV